MAEADMLFLRSLLFNLLFTFWTYGLAVVALPCLIAPKRLGGFAIARTWGRVCIWLLRWCCNVRIRVEGMEHLPAGPALVVSKHQSAWDTLVFWPLLRTPAYVLKKELLQLPFFGWYLSRLGMVAIDRQGGGGALKAMMAEARARAAEGRKIVIFPEGTRVPFSAKGEYQAGAAMLAAQLKLPVIPVALNSGAHWARKAFFKYPGTITIRFLPALEMGGGTRDLLVRMETAIETGCGMLGDGA